MGRFVISFAFRIIYLNMRIILALLFCFFASTGFLMGQAANEGSGTLINLGYGIQSPGGDLDDRFGMNFSIEGSIDRILPNNWILGVQGQYLFGSTVHEDVLANLRIEEGLIIGNDRGVADLQLRERGYYAGLRIGRLFGLSANNPRSGIRINIGAGLLTHRIKIQKDPLRTVNQTVADYEKGYDRLTNGLALHQFIGYQVLGLDGGVNFTAGFEFFEGFTQNRRSFDFYSRTIHNESRLDLLMGFRVMLTLPYYSKDAEDIFY